jgi:hypothetical protein
LLRSDKTGSHPSSAVVVVTFSRVRRERSDSRRIISLWAITCRYVAAEALVICLFLFVSCQFCVLVLVSGKAGIGGIYEWKREM